MYIFPEKDWLSKSLLIVSYDGGDNWRYLPLFHHDIDKMHAGLNDVSCTLEYCIAVGEYYSDSDYRLRPLLVSFGRDNQQATRVSLDNNQLDDFGILFSVNCITSNCLAVGHRTVDQKSNPVIYRKYGLWKNLELYLTNCFTQRW